MKDAAFSLIERAILSAEDLKSGMARSRAISCLVETLIRIGSSSRNISAIKRAIEMVEKGDMVVIAGKGHENYQILKDGRIHFDDREVAREFITGC